MTLNDLSGGSGRILCGCDSEQGLLLQGLNAIIISADYLTQGFSDRVGAAVPSSGSLEPRVWR